MVWEIDWLAIPIMTSIKIKLQIPIFYKSLQNFATTDNGIEFLSAQFRNQNEGYKQLSDDIILMLYCVFHEFHLIIRMKFTKNWKKAETFIDFELSLQNFATST